MPTLTLPLDHAGRPIVELNLEAPSAALMKTDPARLRPRALQVRALVDTGASRTLVDVKSLTDLGLDQVGETLLRSATTGSDPVRAKLFAVSIALAGDVTGVLATELEVVAWEDPGDTEIHALLGRDILNLCVLWYNGPDRTFSLVTPPLEQP